MYFLIAEMSVFDCRIKMFMECLKEVKNQKLYNLSQRFQIINMKKEDSVCEIYWDVEKKEVIIDYNRVYYRTNNTSIKNILVLLGIDHLELKVIYPYSIRLIDIIESTIEYVMACQIGVYVPLEYEKSPLGNG